MPPARNAPRRPIQAFRYSALEANQRRPAMDVPSDDENGSLGLDKTAAQREKIIGGIVEHGGASARHMAPDRQPFRDDAAHLRTHFVEDCLGLHNNKPA